MGRFHVSFPVPLEPIAPGRHKSLKMREHDRRGPFYFPVPYKVAFCVPLPALSLTFNVPL
jgi:hypothetical protein